MVVEVNSRSKTLYKVQLYLLKVIPMVMAFICLLNTIVVGQRKIWMNL